MNLFIELLHYFQTFEFFESKFSFKYNLMNKLGFVSNDMEIFLYDFYSVQTLNSF